MRVVFVPFFKSNPYQRLLMDSVQREGVSFETHRSYHEIYPIAWKAGDVLHLHWPPAYTRGTKNILRTLKFLLFVRRLRSRGVRVVWTIHNLLPHESAWRAADLAIARFLGGTAHRLICHSDAAKSQVISLYNVLPGKIAVIPHGNYIGVYPNQTSRADARAKLGYSEDETVVMFLGRIRPYKGVLDLADGFKRCTRPDLRLLLVGEPTHGLTGPELRAMLADDPRIRLEDTFVPDENLQLYLNAADVCAFPYRTFLTSGAMLLAMSFGRACLTYDSEVSRDLLDVSALAVKAQTPEAWAAALAELGDKEALLASGRRNFERAEKFDWKSIGDATYATYSNN